MCFNTIPIKQVNTEVLAVLYKEAEQPAYSQTLHSREDLSLMFFFHFFGFTFWNFPFRKEGGG